MAQPRGRRGRKRLSGRHLEKLRQQSGAGRRAAARSRSRRVRPLVPPPAARRGGRHGRRRRPSRHLRHPRSREGGLRTVHRAHPAGRRAGTQSRRRRGAAQRRRHGLPLRLRHPLRLLRPRRAAHRGRALPLRFGHAVGCDRRLHVGDPRLGQRRKRRRGRRGDVVRRPRRRRDARHRATAACAGGLRGGQTPLRILCQHPAAGLHGRLCPPSARTGRRAHLGAADVSRPARDGGLPAAPLHPHARLLPRVRRGAVAGRRSAAAADLSRTRGADRGHRLRDHRRAGHRTVPHRRPRSAGGDARRSRDRRGRQLRGGQHRRLLRCRGGRIA